MKRLFAALFTLCLVLSGSARAADTLPEDKSLQFDEKVEAAAKETMKLTEHGVVPSTLRLKKLDGSVFFVNSTKAGLATVEVSFGERRVHCASENMKFENGVMHSLKPIGPRDFALMCFPDKGTYTVTVHGVDGTSKAYSGQVIVE